MGVLEVRDTGVGVSPEEQERLFERLYRSPRAIAEQAQGAGLGLPIARAIVEAHGGWVDLQSEVGVGTVVRVALPRRASGRYRRVTATTAAGSSAPYTCGKVSVSPGAGGSSMTGTSSRSVSISSSTSGSVDVGVERLPHALPLVGPTGVDEALLLEGDAPVEVV